MAIITVDDREYEVEDGQNMLSACLSQGLDLPYFCWHPAMGSVGACRQCAVVHYKDADDSKGRLTMACMTPATDGTRISIKAPEAHGFRASVIEWLMTNHPHDCPVCEEGGECHLQDMTHMSGHVYRRYRFTKRTHRNQYLGPFLTHEMNRCIACYRCVRFYKDYAGGHDLEALRWHNEVYFGRRTDGVLESEFSGNLAEVCPTGVFDDKTMSGRYTRKWDLRSAPSICGHCGVGCNTSPNERYGTVKRILNRYNAAVNGYFICDRGRFGYDFVNSTRRIREVRLRAAREQGAAAIGVDRALDWLQAALTEGKVIGIGSPRASLETNFALRALVGEDNFHDGLSDKDHELIGLIADLLRHGAARTPSLHEAEQADAVLVLGEDVSNTAPRLALTLRQTIRQASLHHADAVNIPRWQDISVRECTPPGVHSPLLIATPAATRLDDAASATFRGSAEAIARLGFAVAHALDSEAPAVPDLDEDTSARAARIATALRRASRPLIVSGTGCASADVIRAAANIAGALPGRDEHAAAMLAYVVPECNSLGVRLLDGQTLGAAFDKLVEGHADTVIVAENDLFRRAPADAVRAALAAARRVIVLDQVDTATTEAADLVLPAATFAESTGTLVSSEGRAQRFYAVLEPVPDSPVEAGWRQLAAIAARCGREATSAWRTVDDVTDACAAAIPALEGIREAAPGAGFRIAGRRLAREPHRYSGRTAKDAHKSVHEPKPAHDPDSPFSFTMEGHQGDAPPALIPFFWTPGWNSVQSLNKFQQEIGGELHGGESGQRLLEPRADAARHYANEMPAAPAEQDGHRLYVQPLYEVFGSDELSALSPPLAERIPETYVALHPEDAETLGLAADAYSRVAVTGSELRLRVRLDASLARGTAGIPVGLAGVEGIILPAWAHLHPDTSHADTSS